MANFLKSLFVKGVEIDTASATTGKVLTYDGTKFAPATPGAGSLDLDDLSDAVITSPEEFQGLSYNGTNWVNGYPPVVTYVRNAEATTLTTGTCVYLFGATGDHASVKRADNNSDATSSKTIGVVGANITASNNGPIITRGYVDGIDLSTGYTAGDILWLGEAGAFTTTKPTAPDHLVFIGVVVRATNNGIIYVATQNGYELDELHNVSLPSPTSGQFLKYNGSLWVADTIDLGTDTTGNYMSAVVGTSPVTVAFTPGEGAGATVSLASGYGDTQNPYASKTANYVLAAPNGSSGAPTFRAIVASDIPTLNQNTTGTAATVTGAAQTAITSVGTLTGLTIGGAGANRFITINAPTGYYAIQYFAINGTNKWHYELNPAGTRWSLVESGVAERIGVTNAGATFSGTVTATTFSGALSGNASTATNLSTDRTNWSTNGTISATVGQLAWKNYGNSHTIFDASNSTSPNGGAVNNTNAQIAWSATYPTLMGWNGINTYGVRVDSARIADIASSVGTLSSLTVSGSIALSASTNAYVSYANTPDTAMPWMQGPTFQGQTGWAFYQQVTGSYRMGFRSGSSGATRYMWCADNTLLGSAPNDGAINDTLNVVGGSAWFSAMPASTGSTVVNVFGFLRYVSSRRELKDNIVNVELSDGLDRILALRPVEFTMKPEYLADANEYTPFDVKRGFIAQETAEVDHRYGQWGWVDENQMMATTPAINGELPLEEATPIYWNHDAVIADLVASIQNINARLQQLEIV